MARSQRFWSQIAACVPHVVPDCLSSSPRIQEIAIRVFRTAHELAMHTVAIFSYEDRMSAHRQKVRSTICAKIKRSTSWLLSTRIQTSCSSTSPILRLTRHTKSARGSPPVGAYLAQDDIIRIALEHGVDMIHPGYVQIEPTSRSRRCPLVLTRSSQLRLPQRERGIRCQGRKGWSRVHRTLARGHRQSRR